MSRCAVTKKKRIRFYKNYDELNRLCDLGWGNRLWYHSANKTVVKLATEFGRDPKYVADVLAVMSPRVTVSRNVRATKEYLAEGVVPSDLVISTHLAMAHYEETGEIRGPKTSRFAKCLMLDEDEIVIDVWMCRALGIRHEKAGTKCGYEACARRIRNVAESRGEMPARVQAAVWAGAYQSHYQNGIIPSYKE